MKSAFGFNIGDIVMCKADSFDAQKVDGLIGVICHFYDGGNPPIGVNWGDGNGSHTCCGTCPDGNGWYVYPDDLVLISKPDEDEDIDVEDIL